MSGPSTLGVINSGSGHSLASQVGDWLPRLAKDINAEHAAAEESAREAVNRAYRAGKLLIQAKGRVGHGDWLTWIDSNLTCTARTAQSYMRIAGKLPSLPTQQAERVKSLSLREAVAYLREPPEKPASNTKRVSHLGKESKNDTVSHLELRGAGAATVSAEGSKPQPTADLPRKPLNDRDAPRAEPSEKIPRLHDQPGPDMQLRAFLKHLDNATDMGRRLVNNNVQPSKEVVGDIYDYIHALLEIHRRLSGGN